MMTGRTNGADHLTDAARQTDVAWQAHIVGLGPDFLRLKLRRAI